MRNKTLFLTDSHLGSGIDSLQRERDLVALLDSLAHEVHTIVLLGDIFDFWFTYRHVVPRGHSRFIGKLAQLSDNGVVIHYFIGNHDMWVFDYFEQEIGAIMHSEPEILEINGCRLLLGHGDGLEKDDLTYNFLKKIFRCRLNQRLFAWVHPWIGFSIATRWSHSSRKSHGNSAHHYRGDHREGIFQYAAARRQHEEFSYALFGHRHGSVLRPLPVPHTDTPALYCNVGNWIERRDYALLDTDGLHLLQYHTTSQP